jgi:N-acetylglucosaminyldiphosphoundecaprenol N-acetyl-beta-D-mannosaminyltransferase
MGGAARSRCGVGAVSAGASRRGRRVTLFGLPIDALTMDETVEAARILVAGEGSHQHVAVNAAKIVAAERDRRLAEIIRNCDLVNADGAGVVWASRLLGFPLPERVAGIDLFERLVETAERDGRSVYLLGARPEVVARVAEVFRSRHPRLVVAGVRDGYWEDDDAVVAEVARCKPDYLFLAVPSPRKEYWLSQYLPNLDVRFAMGVGGAFDVVAGRTARAPVVAQRMGLEWAWRLAQEPRRMWRRYLLGNVSFARLTIREWRWRRS